MRVLISLVKGMNVINEVLSTFLCDINIPGVN